MNHLTLPRRLVLVVALLGLADIATAQTPRASPGDVTLRVGGQSSIITRSMLEALPQRSLWLAEGTDSSAVSGVDLWDVLQLGRAVPAKASGRQRAVMYVRVTGADGQSAVIALVELDPSFSKRRGVLASRRDGQALDAVEGPWRLILPEDLRHARWIRNVVAVSIETLRELPAR